MANSFVNKKQAKLFAASVKNNAPYLEASKSYFKGDLTGKKFGTTVNMYITDPGIATSGIDVTSDDATNVQKEVAITLRNMKASVELSTLNQCTDIESFADEIAIPNGRTIGAGAQKEVVERVILKADGAVIADSASFATLAATAAKLRGVKAAGKLTGWFHPEDSAAIAATGLGNFIPSDIQKDIYGENYLGRFAGAEWTELQELPAFTMGTFTGTSGSTIGATVSANGATSITIADSTLTSASTVNKGQVFYVTGVKTLDLNNVATQENYAFIATADTTGSTGSISVTVNPIYFAKGAAKNVSVSAIASGTVVIPSGQVAGSTYRAIQVRDNDALAFDQYEFPAIPGADEMTESVGKFKIQGAAIGNINTRDAKYRWDFPYIGELVQTKLARIAFVKVS